MDCSLAIMPTEGCLLWSDSHSMDSDDQQSHMDLPPSPWIDALTTDDLASSMTATSSIIFACTGQLTPISNGMDIASTASGSSASYASPSCSPSIQAMPQSAMSSAYTSTERWALEGFITSEETAETAEVAYGSDEHDMTWDQGSDIVLAIPKIEPMDDDDLRMDDIKEAPLTPVPETDRDPLAANQTKAKRPRGRPRKHPLTAHTTGNKITKGRSKTGCLTCRKRKKKCDEAKPRCMNCEKNAVVCEGYPEKQIWKSGKERAEEERLKSYSLPPITMHPIFNGLETLEDMIFWKHYNEHLSTVLTVEGEHKNAFKDMMVPIAVQHEPLMHAILSLASKHMDFETPYGINILKNNPATSVEALQQRSLHHRSQARQNFYPYTDEKPPVNEPNHLITARYGQMLCFLLETLAEGDHRGEHRLHLAAYKTLVHTVLPQDASFLSFVGEFFQYHIFADELIHSAARLDHAPSPNTDPPIPEIHPPRLLGVADGLLEHLSQITAIRNTICSNMLAQVDPVIDYTCLYNATEIDAAIREWTPHWPPGDSRDRVGLLYKQMMRVYLMRTIYPPLPTSPTSSMASSTASLSTSHSIASTSRPTSSVVHTPPRSASASCSTSPKHQSFGCASNPSSSHGHSNPQSSPAMFKQNASRAASPQPIRQPSQQDPRVAVTINESLVILEAFKPSDPSQTLLLLPCFLLGTACFSPDQQERVRTAIKAVKGYTGLRNTDRVLEVLEEVWRLMDAGDWAAVWDWPSVARNMDLDFLPA